MSVRTATPTREALEATVKQYGDRLAQLEQRPFVPAGQPLSGPVWQPQEPVTVVNRVGATAAIAETTVALGTIAGIVVPAACVAVVYKVVLDITAGAGSAVNLILQHKPGGGQAYFLQANLDPTYAGHATIDANSGRVTYQTQIGAAPTYTLTVAVVGWWLQP